MVSDSNSLEALLTSSSSLTTTTRSVRTSSFRLPGEENSILDMSRFCCSQLQVVCKKKRGIWSVVAGPLAMLVILTCVTIAVEEEKQGGEGEGEGEGEEEEEEGSTGKKVVAVASATRMLGVVVWMAMWWVLEPVPLCITALLPLALFPFCNIMNADAVARQYWNDTMSLMLGTLEIPASQAHGVANSVVLRRRQDGSQIGFVEFCGRSCFCQYVSLQRCCFHHDDPHGYRCAEALRSR
jgi:hypothetical protein